MHCNTGPHFPALPPRHISRPDQYSNLLADLSTLQRHNVNLELLSFPAGRGGAAIIALLDNMLMAYYNPSECLILFTEV